MFLEFRLLKSGEKILRQNLKLLVVRTLLKMSYQGSDFLDAIFALGARRSDFHRLIWLRVGISDSGSGVEGGWRASSTAPPLARIPRTSPACTSRGCAPAFIIHMRRIGINPVCIPESIRAAGRTCCCCCCTFAAVSLLLLLLYFCCCYFTEAALLLLLNDLFRINYKQDFK